MNFTDTKILEMVDFLKDTKAIKSTAEFCREIGFMKQNIRKVKSGEAHFTVQHLQAISQVYNINANYILGTSNVKFNSLKTAHKQRTNEQKTA